MKPRCRKGGGATGQMARERGGRGMSGASLPYCSVMLAAGSETLSEDGPV